MSSSFEFRWWRCAFILFFSFRIVFAADSFCFMEIVYMYAEVKPAFLIVIFYRTTGVDQSAGWRPKMKRCFEFRFSHFHPLATKVKMVVEKLHNF